MASGKSNYLISKLLNNVFNNTAYTFPTTVYCALYTANPSASAAGTEVTIGSFGYTRIAVTATSSFFTTSTTGSSISNVGAIIFSACTGTNWGVITGASFLDASSAGNLLYWGALGSSVTVNVGNTFEFLANQFVVSEA